MTAQHSLDPAHENVSSRKDIPHNGDSQDSGIPRGMTLESLIDLTGEMAHLNELVMMHVEKSGGFTCQASYFAIVTPVLDMLETEIRFRYRDGMSKEEIKTIISEWICREISTLNNHP